MAPAVEARSLSALTALADEPPELPNTPTGQKGPLVLYIARVPGSKDVFLTTMKPRQKVVTAQDIESSLYYFHVDVADDEELRDAIQYDGHLLEEELRIEREEQATEQHLAGYGISRKPLPQCPQLDMGNRPEPPPKMYPYFKPPNVDIYEKQQMENSSVSEAVPPPLPKRKLLGPRPLHSGNQSVNMSITGHQATGKENLNPRRWSEQPPLLPPRPGGPSRASADFMNDHVPTLPIVSRPTNRYVDLNMASKTPWEGSQDRAPGVSQVSITLIRRDPTSRGQWNVGKLAMDKTPGHLDLPSVQPSVFLEMLAPGYKRFTDQNPDSLKTTFFSDEVPSSRPEFQTGALPMDVSSTSEHPTTFTRRLLLKSEKNQSTTTIARKKGFRSSTDFVCGSQQGFLSPEPSPTLSSQDYLPSSEPSLSHSKAYTFRSPWNGICEFFTGVTGRSLKLRHTMVPTVMSPERLLYQSPSSVSELRFNLPSSKIISSKKPSLSKAFSKRSSLQQPVSAGSDFVGEDDCWDANEERMDLSLGQERAGGGMGGKQAKLGKLIVEEDGLRMLDLVVAANMAVWWSVYDRGGSL